MPLTFPGRSMSPLGSSAGLPFTPLSISGLRIWLKADAGTYQTAGGSPAVSDGDPVGQWQDQSGNGYHVTQATAGFRPTLKLAIRGSLPVIRFDGIDDSLIVVLGSNINQPNTVLGVFDQGRIFDVTGGVRQLFNPSILTSTTSRLGYFAGVIANDPTPTILSVNSYQQVSAIFNGASSSLRLNGSATSAGNPGTNYMAGTLMLMTDSSTVKSQGNICEILFYDGIISGANLTALENYLKSRWGTP